MHLGSMLLLLRLDNQEELWVEPAGAVQRLQPVGGLRRRRVAEPRPGRVLRVLSMLHAVSNRFEKVRAANSGTTIPSSTMPALDALENVIQTIERFARRTAVDRGVRL